mmetsp:Transcript_26426/g.67929  ORF Transcript_26426/g.67929 Transcript_26426/m.67929 type:complete len:216 (+) Transcript_26426:568-1215(+)
MRSARRTCSAAAGAALPAAALPAASVAGSNPSSIGASPSPSASVAALPARRIVSSVTSCATRRRNVSGSACVTGCFTPLKLVSASTGGQSGGRWLPRLEGFAKVEVVVKVRPSVMSVSTSCASAPRSAADMRCGARDLKDGATMAISAGSSSSSAGAAPPMADCRPGAKEARQCASSVRLAAPRRRASAPAWGQRSWARAFCAARELTAREKKGR